MKSPNPAPPTRESLIDLIEQRYFGGVSRGDFAGILDCFAPDATVIIRHGDHPPRLFSAAGPQPPEISDLMSFYEHIHGNYDCWFGEFVHYLDPEASRAASRFTVRLTPRPEGRYAGLPVQELMNCNFFDLAPDGRIAHMIVYYANAGGGAGAPTGYPPAR
jgi:hypothetical protein